MSRSPEPSEIEELKLYCSSLSSVTELNATLYLLKELKLPGGCEPATCDALLCPTSRGDGYPSRLFFSQQISTQVPRNWNGRIRVAERNWVAFSWKVDGPTRLPQILRAHLIGLTSSRNQ